MCPLPLLTLIIITFYSQHKLIFQISCHFALDQQTIKQPPSTPSCSCLLHSVIFIYYTSSNNTKLNPSVLCASAIAYVNPFCHYCQIHSSLLYGWINILNFCCVNEPSWINQPFCIGMMCSMHWGYHMKKMLISRHIVSLLIDMCPMTLSVSLLHFIDRLTE